MEKNFEAGLKRKLDQREIQPSANAWERVQLQRGKQKKQRPYIMYWVAAIFVIGFGVFMLSEKRQTPEIIVVKEVEKAETPEVSQPKVILPETPKSEKKEIAVSSRLKTVPTEPENQTAPIAPTQSPLQLANAELNRKEIHDKITAEVLIMVESGQKVNEDDVDALIEKARKELSAGHGLSKPTDANALLKASESEMDESFRTGIFESLFKQKRIKVALSSQ